MTDKFQYDVFLSYNSKDKERVRHLADRLHKAGLHVWFDEWILKPGDDIYLTIEHGLEASRTLILCMTSNAFDSDWVKLERSTVMFHDPANKSRCFIPLLLSDCNIPDTLKRLIYVDFREGSKDAFQQLVSTCKAEQSESTVKVRCKREKKALLKKESEEKPQTKKFKKDKLKHFPEPLSEKKQVVEETSEQIEPLAVLERKLIGHKHWVMSVTVSPDGKWMASGSRDKTLRIWDLETGNCLSTLEGHKNNIYSVAITPDGKKILSASDKSVRIWDSLSINQRAQLGEYKNEGRSVFALDNSTQALSGGWDGTLHLWDITSLSCIKIIQCRKEYLCDIFSSTVSQSGKYGLSGHRDGQIRYWNFKTGECLATLKSHSDIVNSVQITSDGYFAVSGSNDKTIKIWDLENYICIGTLEGHQNSVLSVAISPDGTLIASTGFSDFTVRLWDWKSGACLQVIKNEEEYFAPISVAFSPDGLKLAVGTAGPLHNNIYVYKLTNISSTSTHHSFHHYTNAKVVLLGESTVGKTTLAHRLIDDKYKICDSTHGMNVWHLDLSLVPDEFLEREALLWDLAGQEDYRLIHQLFLEETALALLLINPQKDDPFAEAGDWLKALKTAGDYKSKGEAIRLLIFSKVDRGSMKLSNAKIDRFCKKYDFKAWLPTSAEKGLNCSDSENNGDPSNLRQLIAKSIPWEKLPWTSTPKLLARLKKAVMTMRDDTDIRLLRFAELFQRLKYMVPEENFDESDARTALTLLANHGLVHPLKFGDLVLLQSELINGYAGAIVRAARDHIDEIGCVHEADIYGPNFDFTGVERLARPDEELLLRALVQTFLDNSLCIAEDKFLVFPSQYRREKDIPYEPDIFVSYSFSGEWQTIWTTLVVRLWYSNEFERKELWRNAAEFESAKGHVLGLKIDNYQGEGRAIISLYFDPKLSDDLRVIFIEYVHRHLAKYACEVRRDRRYVCKCGKAVKDLEAVKFRFESKEDFIPCQFCNEKVVLIDFIEQRLKSDPVAKKILSMNETATRALDNQALEQILIGHMMAIAGEANQIFRPVSMFDYGIDGEMEFRDNDGKPSGKKIYVQLKSGNSYLRTRKKDGKEIFDIKNEHHLEYWLNQPVDVYLVIRQTDELRNEDSIRWMNISRYLRDRKDKNSRQIVFEGGKLDMKAVWKLRDEFFPKSQGN
jgi:WD40 repeat protein